MGKVDLGRRNHSATSCRGFCPSISVSYLFHLFSRFIIGESGPANNLGNHYQLGKVTEVYPCSALLCCGPPSKPNPTTTNHDNQTQPQPPPTPSFKKKKDHTNQYPPTQLEGKSFLQAAKRKREIQIKQIHLLRYFYSSIISFKMFNQHVSNLNIYQSDSYINILDQSVCRFYSIIENRFYVNFFEFRVYKFFWSTASRYLSWQLLDFMRKCYSNLTS